MSRQHGAWMGLALAALMMLGGQAWAAPKAASPRYEIVNLSPKLKQGAQDGFVGIRPTRSFEYDGTGQVPPELAGGLSPTEPPLSKQGDDAGDQDPTASLDFETMIRDGEALLPLHDWVPLFGFRAYYGEDDYAPRWVERIGFSVTPEPQSCGDRGYDYGVQSGPNITDVLEFGLFQETYASNDDYDYILDAGHDFLLWRWPSTGGGPATLIDYGTDSISFEFDFIGNGDYDNPEFPVETSRDRGDDGLQGNSYIVAVRTSPTWRSQGSMATRVSSARMVMKNTGSFPVTDDGDPEDSYSPNFYDGENLADEVGYSASFTVWDVSGPGSIRPGFFSAWNQPLFLYTPVAEHTRPRWNAFDQLMDAVSGEVLQLRTLISLESWDSLIGINVHSSGSVHLDARIQGAIISDGGIDAINLIREVNVVLTDIGADPFGPRGNGGFDPTKALDPLYQSWFGDVDGRTWGHDVAFNGIWLWHDTNGNAVFDPPTVNENGGIAFNGDFPMQAPWFSDSETGEVTAYDDAYTLSWDYVPLPPDGGDPWWKISMRFAFGTRNVDAGENEGQVEPTPDNIHSGLEVCSPSDYTHDYFVVVRLDSGLEDASGLPGDGTGTDIGADFRAFIEPRRYNPLTGHEDGGIYVDSMIPQLGMRDSQGIITAWQDNGYWDFNNQGEPWWTERTVDANSTLPSRAGIEVHDTVLTYTPDSDSAFASDIMTYSGSSDCCFGHCGLGVGWPSAIGRWLDPFAIVQDRFLNGHTAFRVRWRASWYWSWSISDTYDFNFVYDNAGSRQFAYETVPFRKTGLSGGDSRSSAYPHPPIQPTLPAYSNWPGVVTPGQYPRASNWRAEDRGARILGQKTDIFSDPTCVLGFNMAGIADPFAYQRNQTTVERIHVAFWGPDFHPTDLAPLDPLGRDIDSGILLWEDVEADGTFFTGYLPEQYVNVISLLFMSDRIVPLRDLAWSNNPEPIDLDGDGVPDDMNGDGFVDELDHAWVLSIVPQDLWPVPAIDSNLLEDTLDGDVAFACGGRLDFSAASTGGGDSEGESGGDSVTVIIEADMDVTLYEDVDGNTANGAGQYMFVGPYTDDTRRRALVSFPVEDEIPSDAIIEAVELWLHVSEAVSGEPETIYLTELFQLWGEAQSDAPGDEEAGTLARTGDATWTYNFFNTESWMAPGGSYYTGSVMTSVASVEGLGWYSWGDDDRFYTLRQDVQDWVSNARDNHGWILIGEVDHLGLDEAQDPKRFDTKESGANFQPLLAVRYRNDDGTATALPGSKVPAAKRREFLNKALAAPRKDLSPEDNGLWIEQPGDDLFVTIRTSDAAQRFEKIRAVVPATLPARTQGNTRAGIHYYPPVNIAPSAFAKSSPEESPVQDFWGHDMLEVNVPAKIVDMTNQLQGLYIGGPPLAVLGLDLSTNGASKTLESGDGGLGAPGSFSVANAGWVADELAGDWLVDEQFETFEITGNTAERLTLLGGTPRDGMWRIVRDPSFLEQLVVEFYNEGASADFNPAVDLLPLDIDMEVSGVALYRDNDTHPDNRNGLFDPEVDIPISLDGAPFFTGQLGEDLQVQFVFSSPGTDAVPRAMAEQPRRRQWVPESFGGRADHPFSGPEFFVVLRASDNMEEGNNFRVGIVSWGPNTPTAPDPDTWSHIPGGAREDFSKFEEFPWGARGLGFITLFKTPPMYYWLDGTVAGAARDTSGFNWIRSHSAKKARTGVIEAVGRPLNNRSVVIESASQTELPTQILPGSSFRFVVYGSGFGSEPQVTMSGYNVEIVAATDGAITVSITTAASKVPENPVVLTVRNPETDEEDSRSDLFALVAGTAADQIRIDEVSPGKGGDGDFPVEIHGANFPALDDIAVFFGETMMPVIEVSADGLRVKVGYPANGLPTPGLLDVTVEDLAKSLEETRVEGFEFVKEALHPKAAGCGPAQDTSSPMADLVVFLVMIGALFAAVRFAAQRRVNVGTE